MGWDGTTTIENYSVDTPEHRRLDGNDMVEAINIMVFMGDWDRFYDYVTYHELCPCETDIMPWLIENFFTIMEEWLNDLNGKI